MIFFFLQSIMRKKVGHETGITALKVALSNTGGSSSQSYLYVYIKNASGCLSS